MTGNITPWLVLAGIVAATFVAKGYIRLPMFLMKATPKSFPTATQATPAAASYALGLALAQAIRAEAQAAMEDKVARDAMAAIHDTFTAPFSAPAPAPAGPEAAKPVAPPTV